MKIGLLKIGGRIAPRTRKNINAGEADSILQLLSMEHEVFVFSKYNEKDIEHSSGNIQYVNFLDDDFDISKYDLDTLVVINGSPNFFGGAVDPSLVKNYQLMKNWDGTIQYYLIDPLLYPKQIKKNVLRLSKDETLANSTDITNSKFHIITQCRNHEPLKEKMEKEEIASTYTYFPFDKYPLVLNELLKRNENPEVDLMYGGTFRSGRREKDIVKFYFGYNPEEIEVEIFGKLPLKKFKPKNIEGLEVPKITGEILFYEFTSKMADALSTVVIGDSFYSKCENMSPRFWESILAQNVAFIDTKFDQRKHTLPEELHDLYVDSREDVQKQILKLKENKELKNDILDKQLKLIEGFSNKEYLNSLIEAMN